MLGHAAADGSYGAEPSWGRQPRDPSTNAQDLDHGTSDSGACGGGRIAPHGDDPPGNLAPPTEPMGNVTIEANQTVELFDSRTERSPESRMVSEQSRESPGHGPDSEPNVPGNGNQAHTVCGTDRRRGWAGKGVVPASVTAMRPIRSSRGRVAFSCKGNP
jgi:hypothetical protein